MASTPSIAVMVHDTCDYCFRPFGWNPGEKAICMNCGLENVRQTILVSKEILADAGLLPETAMLAPAAEKAIAPPAQARRPARRVAETATRKKGRRQ